MKNSIILISLSLLLWGCSESLNDETNETNTEIKAFEGVILQGNTIVYADSAAKIELLRLNDGEIITYKGGASGAVDYVKITTSDGQSGFIRFFEFATGDEMAVVHNNSPIFDRPNESSNKSSFYSTLEQVKIIEEKGEWVNIWASEHRKGWIKKSDLIIGQNEFNIAGQYFKIMNLKTAKERRAQLEQLVNNPDSKHLKTLLYIQVEDEFDIKGNFEEWNTAQLDQFKTSHKDIHLAEDKFSITLGARQLSEEISSLFNNYLRRPIASSNSWMDANLKSMWYINITGGAQDILPENQKSDYLGYWSTDKLSDQDRFFARTVLSIDRSSIHIKKQWRTHKDLIFTACRPQSYVDSRCDVLVPELLLTYEEIENNSKWDEFSNLYVTLQDSSQAVEGYYIDNELGNIMGYQLWKGTQSVEGQKAWAHGFWYRRNAEGNAKAVYEILKEINEHYAPLTKELNRFIMEEEFGC